MSVLRYFSPSMIKKAGGVLIHEGPRAFYNKIRSKLYYRASKHQIAYEDFRQKTTLGEDILAAQREKKFSYHPVFGIVIPLYKTKKRYLDQLINSIQSQTYPDYKVFFVDASPKTMQKTILTDQIYALHDNRFSYQILKKNTSIAENTNVAMESALKDKDITHICLCDHDDILAPNALYEYAKVLNENRNIMILYSDEDKTDEYGEKFYDPSFKPDFNPFLLESCNYINHFFAVDKKLLRELKKEDGVIERKEYNGAQDYDLYLRLVEKVEKTDRKNLQKPNKKTTKMIKEALFTSSVIYHIPKILYHWRAGDNSTANSSSNKLYAFESGKKALEDHYRRLNIPIKKVEISPILGYYKTHYIENETPLVSIIIPNKDHIKDLDIAITSIMKGEYNNLEFVIVENNSEDDNTFTYYKEIEKKYKNVKIIYYKGGFNYSKICNYGVEHSKGKYILLLNNDVEMINKASINRMVEILNRKDVGAVGAKLLFSDGTIQHAGVIIGMGGIAGHIFHTHKDLETEYCCYNNLNNVTMNYSAVTAACLMTPRRIFDEVGGLGEDLAVAFNDVDLCLKIRAKNYQIVYSPDSKFYHYESKSRGYEDTPEKIKRFHGEMRNFAKKWKKILNDGDPYYNPNLTLGGDDCSVRPAEEIGVPFFSGVLTDILDYNKRDT